MNSIVINVKKLAYSAFHLFSAHLTIDGKYLVHSTSSDETLLWEVLKMVEHPDGFRGKSGDGNVLLQHRINISSHPELRSTAISDYHDFFWQEFKKLSDAVDVMELNNPEKSPDKIRIENYQENYFKTEEVIEFGKYVIGRWSGLDKESFNQKAVGEFMDWRANELKALRS